ncbi:MAG: trypsin-like peptidase domain-containing protein, partial [Pseudomonadota bacterium]
ETKYTFDVMIPDVNLNVDTLSSGVGAALSEKGAERNTANVAQALFTILSKNPTAHVTAGGEMKQSKHEWGTVGSGFIVTTAGHVITNAHVVKASLPVVQGFVEKRFGVKEGAAAWTALIATFPELSSQGGNQKLKVTLLGAVLKAYAKTCLQRGKVSSTVKIKVIMHNPTQEPGKKEIEYPAKLLKAGDPIPGKDVAVLRIEGPTFPALLLGDDNRVQVGDQIYVVGYPGAAFSPTFLEKSSRLEATITTGIISSKKTASGGWTLLQTDAAISGGNSGGPAFDKDGKVIGIATGSAKAKGNQGGRVEGIHFVVPSTVVREFLNEAGSK